MNRESLKSPNRMKVASALLLGASLVCSFSLSGESTQVVAFSRDASVCVLEIASYWPQDQGWRTARLYGDGRLEVRDSTDKGRTKITRAFDWELTEEAFAAVTQEIEDSGLYAFNDQIAAARELATGKGKRFASESAPTHFKISWLDSSSHDRKEKVTEFLLTYGGAESLLYPEIQEYAAAQRLVIRLLSVNAKECRGCSQ